MNNVLLLGGSGVIGAALLRLLHGQANVTATYAHNAQGIDATLCTVRAVDITDFAATQAVMRESAPTLVLHAAGHANVDFCQQHPDEARQSNVLGTHNVIRACAEVGARLIYLSTNAVFDGNAAPYQETDTPHPINVYGQLKLESEQLVDASPLDHVIVRLILSYGWQPPGARANPLTWVVNSFGQGKPLNLVNDVYENPLYAESAADGLWAIATRGRQALYHLAGATIVNRYELALAIAETFALDASKLNPVSSDFFPTIAPRPKNTSYFTTRAQTELGWQPMTLAAGLARAHATRTRA